MTYQVRGELACVVCGNQKTIGRKLCRRCYNRARKSGALEQYPILGPRDVFENRIKKTPTCWLWTGTTNQYGYGIFLMPGEQPVRAHRFSYEFFVGPIPEGKIIMHTCDNPPCVNPDHLRVGTKDDNNKDTAHKRRHNYGLDHWNGRLSETQVAAIRESTKTQKELSEQYGITQSHISRIKSGESRK